MICSLAGSKGDAREGTADQRHFLEKADQPEKSPVVFLPSFQAAPPF
jgi:hypothetical protein